MQTAPATQPAAVQAESVDAFVDSIGVDTHNNYYDESYGALQSQFASEYEYLGLNLASGSLESVNLTGGGGYYYLETTLLPEMSEGIRFGLGVQDTSTPIATLIADLDYIETVEPGMIASVGGPNEVPVSQIAATQAYQDALYAAIKADPLLSGIPVVTYTIATMSQTVYATLGNQSSNTTDGNAHVYSAASPPQLFDSFYLLINGISTPSDPTAVTETGYPTTAVPGVGVNDDVAARYTLDNIFDLLLDGVSVVQIYELLDVANDPTDVYGSEDHFGLFTASGAPKEDAVVLHNLTTILADPGANAATFKAGTLSYAVSGLASTLNPTAALAAFGYGTFSTYVASQPIYGASYLLERSNGTFDIAVWQEPEIWDSATATQIPASATPVTITLGTTAESIEVYDPLIGTAPIATYTDVSSVTVMVSDHPIIVEVDPFAPGTTPAASTSPAAVTVGSGPDTLTLFMSETGGSGGAEFTVSVDGLQIGGVQTTSASLPNGQAQEFSFLGDFAAGSNSYIVTYLNASNSTLDIDSVDINGSYVPGSYQTLGNTGGVTSSFTQTTGPAAVSLGSGPNTLDLFVSELGEPAGAQFSISVDGQQIGGTQTTTASASQGGVQQFDVSGTFSAGANYVTIDYLNAANSTLYVDSATINNVGIAASTLSLSSDSDGDLSFSQSAGGPAPVTLGFGSDTLAVFVSERSQPSGAQFTISVDGQQIGGLQTTTADDVQGQSQEFDLLGNYGVGNHTVSIDYVNAYDSLVLVDGVTFDGTAVANSQIVFSNFGTQSVTFTKPGTAVALATGAAGSSSSSTSSGTTSATTSSSTSSSSSSSTSSSSTSSSSTSSTGTVVIGSGSDTLALTMSERSATNGAQFTVSVDGTQIGGVQTTTANSLAGQTEIFDVEGTFAPGSHIVSIDYVNANNSLLYVDGATVDGAAVPNSSPTLSNNGAVSFGFIEAGGPTTQVIGSGSDTLALAVSEQSASGAQFTVSVDGTQIGGVQTTTASNSAGQTQTIDVLGNFGAGSHTVAVDYLNANNSVLYVNGATIDGTAVPNSNPTLSNTGVASFGFTEPTSPTSGATIVGSGPDSLDLFTSERSEPAGAQFTVSVDGQQIGGVETVTANSLAGQDQQFDILGNFAPGSHTASIDYINANNSLLSLNSASINGATISGSGVTVGNNGTFNVGFATPAAPAATFIGSGPDTLALNISEDYYVGNAQFTVAVDGQQIGGTQTASAIHGNGQSQTYDVLGAFTGTHTVSIDFLNDASTNNPGLGTDRNLYVGGAAIDGATIANSSLSLYSGGTQSFVFTH